MRIAILSTVFIGEYGVTRVLANQLHYLLEYGYKIDLFVCDLDKNLVPNGVSAYRIPTHFKGVGRAIKAGNYDIVIACTDPFYKIIADLKLNAITIAYEHGYIPVELTIKEEREAHSKMIEARVKGIYPSFTAVVTISNFAVNYIKWPKAIVIYNGGDHFLKFLETNESIKTEKIQILMVSRFRTTEWDYKGLDFLCQLKKDLGNNYEISIIGGGDDFTYEKLRNSGINAFPAISSPKEMARQYKNCDVVVSFSKCENFNLPLVEAGFFSKPALAFNLCAHPEVSPFVFNTYEEIFEYLKFSTKESLKEDGRKMFQFVDKRFRSKDSGLHFLELVNKLAKKDSSKSPSFSFYFYGLYWIVRDFIRVNLYKKWKERK